MTAVTPESSQESDAGPRRRLADLEQENSRLGEENARLARTLTEALEQQTATSEILRVIASSPTDLQPVLDTMAASAMRLSESSYAVIFRLGRDGLRCVALSGAAPGATVGHLYPVNRGSAAGRAVIDHDTVYIGDLFDCEDEFPETAAAVRRLGFPARTTFAVPLLRQGQPIGAISVGRPEVGEYSDQQIDLVKTFADQAVIAIENTRLFQELHDRNRDLGEALEQQTAMAEVLRVIASAPTDLKNVLRAIVDTATRLCEAEFAVIYRAVEAGFRALAYAGTIAPALREMLDDFVVPQDRSSVAGTVGVERRTVHIHDVLAWPDYGQPDAQRRGGYRSMLGIPMLREGELLGVITAARTLVRPFTERQIELLESFADQAVIAIENTRLFQELEERTRELARSVEELQALGEVGQAVSSSLDLQTVLSTIVAHADRLCGTDDGVIFQYDEQADTFVFRASHQQDERRLELIQSAALRLGEGAVGRAALERAPVQFADITAEGAYQARIRDELIEAGTRAILAVPLLREERVLGGIVLTRRTPGAFPPEVVALLQTFAGQSVLAIENARLFQEVEDKSRQLEAASRHKSEFLANMSHELRTPLNAINGFSEVLLERYFGELNDKQEEYQRDILSSGQHLLSLINDILDLSKIEAGRMELEVGQFSLREALGNGLTMLRERASRHGIALSLEMDPDLDLIEADERKVKQVLFNLLSNAVKFTPDGGRVEVRAERGASDVLVAVSDTGVGISPEDLPHIFEEFRQVGQGTAKAEGTGLGLALAKKFVELHGGRIGVESVPGAGSTFTFSLPLERPATPESPAAPRP